MKHCRLTTGSFLAVLSPPMRFAACLALTLGLCVTTINAQTITQIIDSSGVTAGVLDPLEAADDGLGGDYNRFGDFKMPTSTVAGGQEVAIRVKLNRMYIDKNEDRNNGCPVRGNELPDLSVFENEVRYLGPPGAFDDNEFDAPKFIAAELQCTPFVRDWSPAALAADFSGDVNTDTIFYFGAEVVPCSIHAVQQGTQACVESGNPEDCLSDPLEVRTALWGDIWPPFGGYREPQLFDVTKMRDAGKGLPGGPSKVRAALRNNVVRPEEDLFLVEIIFAVEKYERLPYSEVGPSSCTVTTMQMGAEVAEIAQLTRDLRSTSKGRPEWTRSTAPVCGDLIIEGCEQCDDGNTNPNDGCDADCRCECDENCPGEEGATAYFKLVPVSPQGGAAPPYPNCQDDSCISGSTITLPSGERQVWLEVRLGGWGNLFDVTGWQAVLDASSFCSGTGDPLQTFRPECEDDQCVCRQVNDDGGAPCNKYPNLFPDMCEPGFQQLGQETFLPLTVSASDNSGENIRSLGARHVLDFQVFDPGTEFYGATWVLNIPAGASGTYTIELNACGDSVMISGPDFLIPIDRLEPAVIVIEDAVVAGAGPADALVRGSNTFGLANGERMNRVGAFKMPASYVAGAPESVVAIRVEIVDLYIDTDHDAVNGCPVRDSKLPDLSAFNGQVRYLGPPSTLAGIIAAELQCTPFYRDWSPAALTADFPRLDTSTIYYYGAAVLPCSVYEARYGEQGGELSQALEIRTALWGDVWPPFGIVNFTDIGSVVKAFKSIAFIPGCPPKGAPRKFQAMLRENSVPLGSTINFTDIGNVVRAFKTIAYAEDGPTACP